MSVSGCKFRGWVWARRRDQMVMRTERAREAKRASERRGEWERGKGKSACVSFDETEGKEKGL